MATFRKVILVVLVVTHLLLAGGAFVSCVEDDGSLATEFALAVCCDQPTSDAPSAPEAPASLTNGADDCGACVDERFMPSVERPHGAAASLSLPVDVAVASVDLDLSAPSRPAEVAVLPPDTSPRRLRPALLRS